MNLREVFSERGFLNRDRTSVFLLVSLLLFFILAPLLEFGEVGRIVLVLNLYATLITATMQLAGRRAVLWGAIPIAACSMFLLMASHYHQTPAFLLANGIVLAAFLILVSVALFNYLGDDSTFTNGRLYASVSLYLMLGVTWFAIYNVINIVQPGSFTEGGMPLPFDAHSSKILYFSLTTLATLGYGDIVPVRPAARMIATLEAAAGVLYLAITVARLVASKQTEKMSGQQ